MHSVGEIFSFIYLQISLPDRYFLFRLSLFVEMYLWASLGVLSVAHPLSIDCFSHLTESQIIPLVKCQELHIIWNKSRKWFWNSNPHKIHQHTRWVSFPHHRFVKFNQPAGWANFSWAANQCNVWQRANVHMFTMRRLQTTVQLFEPKTFVLQFTK